ncbi:hypothetical protein BDK92_7267 [Micromonospora pisi]|uniref:Uncharacterized protein n=1 Tax=Micromonospora pisi TaxID=589240 RepID=A0A495JUU3_9ACTN|nr:hypothetical protein [Micromonospora pisi]RKR92787.1 hypothetical protein BDK92_7267 [Micromonospora pisi]
MSAQYRVTAAVVVVTAITAHGPALSYVYRDAFVPAEAKPAEIRHLLRRGMIERVGRSAPPVAAPPAEAKPDEAKPDEVPADAPDSAPVAEPNGTGDAAQQAVPFDDPDRAAARAKLPDDGALPDGRAAHAVWIEAAVARGYAYEAAAASSKDELRDLLKQ